MADFKARRLAALLLQPNERVAKKPIDHVNDVGRAFIAASPFLVLATGSRQGLDCSPKGDQPGFVQVAEDGRTLFIPDRRGNNRIDGLKNLIDDPRIALIFLVPGVNETYRVNGRAQISQDADLKRRFAVNGKEPATIMVVTVEETFQHCGKALVRSDLWKAGSHGRPQGVPAIGDFVAKCQQGQDLARRLSSAAFTVLAASCVGSRVQTIEVY
jgi:PPOX class probable FMN-dependent enzyme